MTDDWRGGGIIAAIHHCDTWSVTHGHTDSASECLQHAIKKSTFLVFNQGTKL